MAIRTLYGTSPRSVINAERTISINSTSESTSRMKISFSRMNAITVCVNPTKSAKAERDK